MMSLSPISTQDCAFQCVSNPQAPQRLGATTLFVTHDQVEAMTLADRIVVMNKGRIEQVGTPRAVYGSPQSAYVASFIGTPGMNLIKGADGPGAWNDYAQ